MHSDTITFLEGAVIVNLTVDSGTSFPLSPSIAEQFFRTDSDSLYINTSAGWTEVAGSTFPLAAPDGTAATPQITFLSDTDTGMYRAGTNNLGFTTDGTRRLEIRSDGSLSVSGTTDYELLVTNDDDIPNKKYVDDAIFTHPDPHLLGNGVVGAPTYSFSDDTDTGMYTAGSNSLGFVTGGSERFRIKSDGVLSAFTASYETLVVDNEDMTNKKYVDDAITAGAFSHPDPHLLGDGSASAPSYSFSNNSNLGIYRSGAHQMNFATNGVNRLVIEADGTLAVNTASYEALVLSDADVPNKKYVDDAITASSTPAAGSSTELQFNTAGAFAADSNLTWNGTTLNVGGFINVGTGASSVIQSNTFTFRVRGQSSVGGVLRLAGGSASATGAGGNVLIDGGVGGSTSGAGGSIIINGGVPTDGNGGTVSIAAVAGVGTNRDGGDVNINAGDATGTGDAGDINLLTGTGGIVKITNGPVHLDDGTVAAPSLSFVSDDDTGMYLSAADELSFGTGGIRGMYISDARAIVIPNEVQVGPGTAADPGYTFTTDGDTGMYLAGTNNIGFTTSGTRRLEVRSDGSLSVSGTTDYENVVTDDDDIPNRKYVLDNTIGNVVEDLTPQLGADLDVNGNTITGLPATPAGSSEAASKAYVDSLSSGLDPKESVRAATTANLSGTFASGSPAGEGTTITLVGASLVVDGVTMANGDRLLVKDQSAALQNGIYTVSGVGSTVVLTRATDQDGTPTNEVSGGNYTFVEQGTANQGTGYNVVGDGELAVDVDALNWSLISGPLSSFPLLGPDGSASDPTYSFSSDTNSGLYLSSSNVLGLATDGSIKLSIGSVGMTATLPLRHTNGSAAAPSIAFTNDTDMGMYRPIADALAFAVKGEEKLRIIDTGMTFTGANNFATFEIKTTGSPANVYDPVFSLKNAADDDWTMRLDSSSDNEFALRYNNVAKLRITTDAQIHAESGSATSPTYAFNAGADTGMYYVGSDVLAFTTGGTKRMEINSAGDVIIDGAADALQLRGSASDITNQIYMEFLRSDNTRIGYVGEGSTGSSRIFVNADLDDLYLQAVAGDVRFIAGGTNHIYGQTNGVVRFDIDTDGTISVGNTVDYEDLVTGDDDIPNKKYVDDNSGLPLTGGTLNAGSLGATLDDELEIFETKGLSSNGFGLVHKLHRYSAGSNHETAEFVLQNKVDSTHFHSVSFRSANSIATRYFVIGYNDSDLVKIDGNGKIRSVSGTETNPTYTFDSDANTGMYSSAANSLAFATGGTKALQLNSDQVVDIPQALRIGTTATLGTQLLDIRANGTGTDDVRLSFGSDLSGVSSLAATDTGLLVSNSSGDKAGIGLKSGTLDWFLINDETDLIIEHDTSTIATFSSTGLNVTGSVVATQDIQWRNGIDGSGGQLSFYSGGSIASLVPGSTFGALIEGRNSGHLVVGIHTNDANDGFHVVRDLLGTGSPLSDYEEKLFTAAGDRVEFGKQAKAIDGSVTAPSYSFTTDGDTGIYRVTSDTLGIASNGVKRASFQDAVETLKLFSDVSGPAASCYVSFNHQDDTRIGYVGDASGSDAIALVSNLGNTFVISDNDEVRVIAGTHFRVYTDTGSPLAATEAFRINNGGQARGTDGTASLPGYSFLTDADTGMYRSSSNNLSFTTAGTEQVRIDGSGRIFSRDGAVATPTYSFLTATTTGMYLAQGGSPLTDDGIGIVTNGAERVRINGSGRVLVVPSTTETLTTDGYLKIAVGGSTLGALVTNTGSTSLRTHHRYTVSDTVVGEIGTDDPDFVINSTGKIFLRTDGTTRLQITDDQSLFGDGTVSAPSISFASDTNTGMYRIGADEIGFAADGNLVLSLKDSLVTSNYDIKLVNNNPDLILQTTDAGNDCKISMMDSTSVIRGYVQWDESIETMMIGVNSSTGTPGLFFYVEHGGPLSVSNVTDYEDLVTSDDDIPNKKYVDDAIGFDLGEFTVAGLPSASANANGYALATNASGGRTVVRSDGTNWKVIAVEGATVST